MYIQCLVRHLYTERGEHGFVSDVAVTLDATREVGTE